MPETPTPRLIEEEGRVGQTSELMMLLRRCRKGERLWPPLFAFRTLDRTAVEFIKHRCAVDLRGPGDAVRVLVGVDPHDAFTPIGLDFTELEATDARLVALLREHLARVNSSVHVACTTYKVEVEVAERDEEEGDGEDVAETDDPGTDELVGQAAHFFVSCRDPTEDADERRRSSSSIYR